MGPCCCNYAGSSLAAVSTMTVAIPVMTHPHDTLLPRLQAFCRKFSWAELQLWPDDLPARSVVVLSGGDDLVPSELVRAQLALKQHPAKVRRSGQPAQ